MKKLIIPIFMGLFLLVSDTYAQGPGDFYIENNTGCAYSIDLYHTNQGCGGFGCAAASKVSAQFQAAPNATTKVDDGSAYGSSDAWIQVTVLPGGGSSGLTDGYCTSSGSGPECNGADITVTFIDCNNAKID